jgi:hypothetical protein
MTTAIKNLNALAFSTILLTPTVALSRSEGSTPSVWEDSTAGKCYASIEEFNKTSYGDDYLNDDNIQKMAVKKSNKSYIGYSTKHQASILHAH